MPKIKTLLLGCCLVSSQTSIALELEHYPRLKAALAPLLTEKLYTQHELDSIFADVRLRPSVEEKKKNAAEKKLTWAGDAVREGGYRGIFLKPETVRMGVEFWQKHQDTLNRASQVYGVEPEVICAIIGVETKYGLHKGNDLVIESTATLANRGSKLQSRQLAEFLRLVKAGHVGMETVGSYSGAMGFPQFISTSYTAYAVDFNDDGVIDLLDDPVDAIGSVANYFKQHGWRHQEQVTFTVEPIGKETSQLDAMAHRKRKTNTNLGEIAQVAKFLQSFEPSTPASVIRLLGKHDVPEYHVALHNFYVITKYNHSVLYAMAVYQLSEMIKQSKLRADANVDS